MGKMLESLKKIVLEDNGLLSSGKMEFSESVKTSSSLPTQISTSQTPPVYTPLESNKKLESKREPEPGDIIFVRLDTPCYVCGSFEFWEFLNEGNLGGSHFKEIIRRCYVCHPPAQGRR